MKNPDRIIGRWSSVFQYASLFLLTVFVAGFFSRLGIDPHHQGIMFKPALDVAHGKMLFRDSFTQYGALTTLIQASALRLFGDRLVVIQLQTAVFYGLIAVLLRHLWVRVIPGWLASYSVVLWLFAAPYFIMDFHPWSSVYALFFQLFSVAILLHAIDSKSNTGIFISGGFAALSFWCRQPVGVFHAASMFLFIATLPLKSEKTWKAAFVDCFRFAAGMAVFSGPIIFWITANNALHDWYLQSIRAAYFFAEKRSSGGGGVFESIVRVFFPTSTEQYPFVTFIWILLPVATITLFALLFAGIIGKKLNRGGETSLYGLLLLALASWIQYYPVPDIRHAYWGAAPMIGILSFGVWRTFASRATLFRSIAVCIIITTIFGYDMILRLEHGINRIKLLRSTTESPQVLRGMYGLPRQINDYSKMSLAIEDAIREDPGIQIVTIGKDALYLTFAGYRENFHQMYINWNTYNLFIYPSYIEQRNNFIRNNNTLILTNSKIFVPLNARFIEQYENILGEDKRLILYRNWKNK